MPTPSEGPASQPEKQYSSRAPQGPGITASTFIKLEKEASLRAKLREYVAQYGLEPADLDARAMRVMLMARELEDYVDRFAIPVATESDEEGESDFIIEDQIQEEVAEVEEQEEVLSVPPADSLDLVPISSPYDLPRIPLHEFLLEEAAPDLFWKRVVQREVNKPQWLEARDIPVNTVTKYPRKEVVETKGGVVKPHQHAIVLFDASPTMFKDDGRGEFAKALALAFLRKAHEQNSALHLVPFGRYVAKTQVAVTDTQFTELAKRLLTLSVIPGNGTQQALEAGVHILQNEPALRQADIFLITDGRSELTDNPLRGHRLHTFRVFGSKDKVPPKYLEERIKLMQQGITFHGDPYVPDGIPQLKLWSTQFVDINTKEIPSIASPMPEEIDALVEEILSHEEELPAIESLEDFAGIEGKLDELQNLLDSLTLPPLGDSEEKTEEARTLIQQLREQLSDHKEEMSQSREDDFFENMDFLPPRPKGAPRQDPTADTSAQKGGNKTAERGESDLDAADSDGQPDPTAEGAADNAEQVKAGAPPPPREIPEHKSGWWMLIQFIRRLMDPLSRSNDDEAEHEHQIKEKQERRRNQPLRKKKEDDEGDGGEQAED